jgi:hypothetical protein
MSTQAKPILLALSFALGGALSGCASVDQAMFGNSAPAQEPSTVPESEGGDETSAATEATAPAAPAETQTAQTAPAPQPEAAPAESEQEPGTLPGSPPPVAEQQTASAPVAAASAIAPGPSGPVVGAVSIAPGADTGTGVSHTIAGLRASLQEINGQMATSGQQLATVRNSSTQQIAAYHQASAQIATHLQIGTTRGNPQLVGQWNSAQGALDQLTANLNALSTIGAQVGGESSRAKTLLAQIRSTDDTPGAVDEDHRQLTILEDEANQILVLLDRLGHDAASDLRRQTTALANERASLTKLASAIKSGDLYESGSGTAIAPSSATRMASAATPAPGAPLVTIHFSKRANYEKTLYGALSQALQNQPSASFSVVGVSPVRGNATAVQTAQTDALRHAQEVMHTMAEMGVPATRVDISSSTDPAIRASEVRVFLR